MFIFLIFTFWFPLCYRNINFIFEWIFCPPSITATPFLRFLFVFLIHLFADWLHQMIFFTDLPMSSIFSELCSFVKTFCLFKYVTAWCYRTWVPHLKKKKFFFQNKMPLEVCRHFNIWH